jgi:hypothetical protein
LDFVDSNVQKPPYIIARGESYLFKVYPQFLRSLPVIWVVRE